MPFRPFVLAAAVLMGGSSAFAQSLPGWAAPSGPSAPSPDAQSLAPPNPPGPPPRVPVDGGLGLLALAGAGLAAQRLRQRRTR
jgi:hypothetical protein